MEAISRMNGFLLLLVVGVISILLSLVLIKTQPSLFSEETVVTDENWTPKRVPEDIPEGYEGKLITYGYYLISETPKWMGPQTINEDLRYAGNNLACKNCHLENGTKAGSASWVGVSNRFPQFRGRENKIGTLEERVNGCMERSMNGTALPETSRQMKAIIAYMDWLSEGVPPGTERFYKGFTKVEMPDFRADPKQGKALYQQHCVSCHAEDGQGAKMTGANESKGYVYPPLWGQDSYNHGAGMNRVLTAAQFIKANMPFGLADKENPVLTDEESIHIAAYIDSFDRPNKSNPEQDFPDKKLKPVSTPYGPWEDEFSAEQHKYGPFKPIADFYKTEYGIEKSK